MTRSRSRERRRSRESSRDRGRARSRDRREDRREPPRQHSARGRRGGGSTYNTRGRGNPANRTTSDARYQRAQQDTTLRTAEHQGSTIFVPGHEPARLQPTKGGVDGAGPSNIAASMVSYADMARGTGLPTRGDYYLQVFRKDRAPFVRGDQWKLQKQASVEMVEAMMKGDTIPENSGTRLQGRSMLVFCKPEAGAFFKGMVGRIGVYDAYLPGERIPGTQIYGTIPREFEDVGDQIHLHFAAGTFGAVKPSQVSISRQAWCTPTSNLHVHLEVDQEAFDWLKRAGWMSAMGLHIVRWAHPPVRGLSGYIPPDSDTDEMIRRLQQESQHASGSGPLVPETSTEDASERTRHVTGEDGRMEVDPNVTRESQRESEDEIPELKEHRNQEPVSEEELGGDMNRTLTEGHGRQLTSTPVRPREADPTQIGSRKSTRLVKSNGTIQSDPSDNESES